MKKSGKGDAKEAGGIRVKRFEKELLSQLNMYVSASFQGELPGLLCLNSVKATPDLRAAKVLFSVINGSDADEKVAGAWLKERAIEMQHRLATVMKMRYTPKLTFQRDTAMDRALKIEQLIAEVSKNELAKKSAQDESEKGE